MLNKSVFSSIEVTVHSRVYVHYMCVVQYLSMCNIEPAGLLKKIYTYFANKTPLNFWSINSIGFCVHHCWQCIFCSIDFQCSLIISSIVCCYFYCANILRTVVPCGVCVCVCLFWLLFGILCVWVEQYLKLQWNR